MRLQKPTPEELREELHDTLLDLCGDVYLLDCLLFPGDAEKRPDLWEPQAVRAAVCRRLTDYIEQHTKDVKSITLGLKKEKNRYIII